MTKIFISLLLVTNSLAFANSKTWKNEVPYALKRCKSVFTNEPQVQETYMSNEQRAFNKEQDYERL